MEMVTLVESFSGERNVRYLTICCFRSLGIVYTYAALCSISQNKHLVHMPTILMVCSLITRFKQRVD